ncbi:hypothetical protein F0L74_20695 [Chitinophaga agrisoli]|uniref:Acid shock protein n=1 Tax=Chitinophaga agrisoli TaxID=2607653 RepID=A0A5B2VGF5_9BACT|nr:hypothetical protein [Chitinophaga agrisoli]KAA2238643.1 hypothetical protein F0L74_20695 [Chitinophaga agrisoli]
MKKLGMLMAVAMLFAGTATFANNTAKTVKHNTQQTAPAQKTQKAHKVHKAHAKHHTAKSKAAGTAAPKAK